MTQSPAWLEEIEKRLNAATPGPYRTDGTFPAWDGEEYAMTWVETPREKWTPSGSLSTADDMCQQRADANLFSHAPEDIARLIGALKVATEALDSVLDWDDADAASIAREALAKIKEMNT